MNKPISKILWKDISHRVHSINKNFAILVDELSPGESHPLYLLKFPYGTLVGDNISQFIPDDQGGFYRLSSLDAPKDIMKHLGYGASSSPLGLVLNKTIEFFVDIPEKRVTIPTSILHPGDFLNFTRILSQGNKIPFSPNGILYSSSGARTTFCLPPISDNSAFLRLQNEIGEITHRPESLYSHCLFFSDICKNIGSGNPWELELIYFSKSWVDDILNNKRWNKLSKYLYQLAWSNSDFNRNQFFFDISYSLIKESINRENPYLIDTARHLLDITVGAYPGLIPAHDNNLIPLNLIQHVLTHSYGMKNYIPTIMVPHKFNYKTDSEGVYYTLKYPTTKSFSPKPKKSQPTLSEIALLREIMNKIIPIISNKNGAWSGTLLQDAINNTSFQYIHSDALKYLKDKNKDKAFIAKLPSEIRDSDQRLGFSFPYCSYKNSSTCYSGKLFKGCIRIKPTGA